MTNLDIFNKNKNLVYSIVNRYRKNNFEYKTYIDWDEIEQVGLIALFKAIQGYNDSKGSFKNYAISAIRRAIMRQINFDNKVQDHTPIESAYKIPAENTDTDNKIDITELTKNLSKAIDKLSISDRSKEILRLRAKGMTYQAIADTVGVSQQSVSQVIDQQKNNLRARLSKEEL